MTSELSLPLILDICLCLLVVGLFAAGWKKGFAGMFVHAFSGLLALILAYFVSPYLAQLCSGTGLTGALAGKISEGLQLDSLIPASLGGEEGLISSLPLPEVLKTVLISENTEEMYRALGVTQFGEYISSYLARIIINGACILLVFILGVILLRWLADKLELVNKIPLVGTVNSLVGGLLGLIIALVIFALICFVTTSLSSISETAATISAALSDSFIAGWLVRNEMGLSLLSKVLQ